MHLRSPRLLTAIAVSTFLLASASVAMAAGEKDKEALKLHDSAMNDDYLAVEFAKAEKKLGDALKKCGKDGCSPEVLGKIHIALGIVKGASGKLDLAKDELVAALKQDPKAAIPPDLKTPELEKAFQEAQKEAGGSGAASGGTGEEPSGEEPKDKPKPAAGGDLTHTPIAEQAVNTPVPVYVEVPEDVGGKKATLRYKPFGATKWKSLDMRALGDGFGVEIPCDDVTTTGDIKYYVIVKDEQGEQVATAGSLKEPHRVPIKNELEGEEPSLPGKKPPTKCQPKEDCPPGFPGCEAKGGAGGPRGDKGWGASCDQTQECQAGFICSGGTCQEGKEEPGGGSTPSGPGKRNVLGLWFSPDLLVISGAKNVCSPLLDGEQNVNYACFKTSDGSQFYGLPYEKAADTNGIEGGFALAGARLMLSYDRKLLEKYGLFVGARVGFAFGGSPSSENPPPDPSSDKKVSKRYPKKTESGESIKGPPPQAQSFLPLHLEARAGWVFGGNPLEHKKIRPYAFLAGGLAQVNGSVPVMVCDTVTDKGHDLAGSEDACEKSDSVGTRKVEVDAYQITGLNFFALGGGAVYGILPNFGVGAELKAMFMVPTFGFVIAPTIGPVFGF